MAETRGMKVSKKSKSKSASSVTVLEPVAVPVAVVAGLVPPVVVMDAPDAPTPMPTLTEEERTRVLEASRVLAQAAEARRYLRDHKEAFRAQSESRIAALVSDQAPLMVRRDELQTQLNAVNELLRRIDDAVKQEHANAITLGVEEYQNFTVRYGRGRSHSVTVEPKTHA